MTPFSADRFYVELLAAGRVALPEDQAHHAARVLRLRAGAEVELFDGRGRRARGTLAAVSRHEVTADVPHVAPPAERPRPLVHLGFAVPKGKRVDWLLEKATELGAASLRPVVFHRSVAGGEELDDAKRRRWLGHCISAAKQCHLDFLPELLPHQTLAEHLAEPCDGPRLMGEAGPLAKSLVEVLGGGDPPAEVRLLVGPEGAPTDEELTQAIEAGWQLVRIGHTIMRVETAAVALVAATTAICEPRQ